MPSEIHAVPGGLDLPFGCSVCGDQSEIRMKRINRFVSEARCPEHWALVGVQPARVVG